MTSETIRQQFPIGTRVITTDARYVLRGQSERGGRVVGYSTHAEAVRVSWDGWKHSQAVFVAKLTRVSSPGLPSDIDGVIRGPHTSGLIRVDCPQAPEHLRVLYLSPWQISSAKVGDRVRLAYRISPSSGLWVVSEVLS